MHTDAHSHGLFRADGEVIAFILYSNTVTVATLLGEPEQYL